jgi:hypothetical protein
MSSNLILKDGIIEKTINKKTCKRKGIAKKGTRLKSNRKKSNEDEILTKINIQNKKNLQLKELEPNLKD